ncbi:putative sugar kinase [uncultured archaeon]|nr:putative sugar kinase [uncultured archaeon]
MSRLDVVICGSAVLDMFARAESRLVKIETRNSETDLLCFRSGSKIQIDELTLSVGGGAINAGTAIHRLGIRAGALIKLGEDSNGQYIADYLGRLGLPFFKTPRSHINTGFSVIFESLDGDRTILAYKGANDDLNIHEINVDEILDTEWMYFASMTGESLETQIALVAQAKKKGIKILYAPSSYLLRDGAEKVKPLITAADILIMNMEEAHMLLGRNFSQGTISDQDTNEILKGLHKICPRIVVVTNGDKPANAYDGKTRYTCQAYPVKAVELAGAGDAFAAALLAGIIKENSIEAGMEMGIANSSSVITKYGTTVGLLSYEDCWQRIRQIRSEGYTIEKKAI